MSPTPSPLPADPSPLPAPGATTPPIPPSAPHFQLTDVLADGARRARVRASVRLADVYEKVGFLGAGSGSTR